MSRLRVGTLVPALLVFLVVARPAVPAAAEPSLPDVLARAAVYVDQFERTVSGIVAEEQYIQELRFPRAGRIGRDRDRRMRSDLLLVKPVGAESWLQFRDVYEVDGRAVRNRDQRLVRLFVDPPASVQRQVKAIAEESARYNIGVARTVNSPLLPLLFLEARNQRRVRFSRTDDDKASADTLRAPTPAGHFRVTTEVWTVEYREQTDNTLIKTMGSRDLPARGRFWIEPSTGRVLMSEVVLSDWNVHGVITVNYQSEPIADVLLPIEMRERYDRLPNGAVIDGFATYGRFRQFQVKVDETLVPVKK